MLDYNLYIEQILEMISRLKVGNLQSLEKDNQLLDATIMRLQVIGESANKVSIKTKKKYSHIDWSSLVRTRDFISHNYEKVNPIVMREFILNKLLPMEKDLKKILKEENKE